MGLMKTRVILFLFVFILVLSKKGIAQITFYPGVVEQPIENVKAFSKTPSSSNNILELPIFEDFSTYTGRPDTTIWDSLGGAQVVRGVAYHPPSLGVAMFDGLDEFGRPYEFIGGFPKGATDYLESKPINLSIFFGGDSLYLSFYWQQGGRGEGPEFSDRDSLVLEFWNGTDSTWDYVWGRIARTEDSLLMGGDTITALTDTFFVENIPGSKS